MDSIRTIVSLWLLNAGRAFAGDGSMGLGAPEAWRWTFPMSEISPASLLSSLPRPTLLPGPTEEGEEVESGDRNTQRGAPEIGEPRVEDS